MVYTVHLVYSVLMVYAVDMVNTADIVHTVDMVNTIGSLILKAYRVWTSPPPLLWVSRAPAVLTNGAQSVTSQTLSKTTSQGINIILKSRQQYRIQYVFVFVFPELFSFLSDPGPIIVYPCQ